MTVPEPGAPTPTGPTTRSAQQQSIVDAARSLGRWAHLRLLAEQVPPLLADRDDKARRLAAVEVWATDTGDWVGYTDEYVRIYRMAMTDALAALRGTS